MKFVALVSAVLAATPAVGQVVEGDAMRPRAEAMRKAWRQSPSKPVAITVPLFGRVMRLDMLRDFVPAYEAQNGTSFMFEFLPDGQKFDNWTRMVTITAVRGGGVTKLSDLDLASRVFDNPKGCLRGHFYRALGKRDAGDGVSVVTANKGCAFTGSAAYPGASKQTGEQSLIMHFRDAQNIYSLQYAQRGQPLIPDANVAATLRRFGAVQLVRK